MHLHTIPCTENIFIYNSLLGQCISLSGSFVYVISKNLKTQVVPMILHQALIIIIIIKEWDKSGIPFCLKSPVQCFIKENHCNHFKP